MFGRRFKTVGIVTISVYQYYPMTSHKSFTGQYAALLQENARGKRRVRTVGYIWGVNPLTRPSIQLWVLGGPLPPEAVVATTSG